MYFKSAQMSTTIFFLFFSECTHSTSKNDIFEEWVRHDKSERNARLFEFVMANCNITNITEESERIIKMKLAKLSSTFASKWTAAGKSKERFIAKNKEWLEGEDIKFKVIYQQPQQSTSQEAAKAGRPRKDFEDSSYKTKKRRVEDLTQSRSAEELLTAAEVAVRSTGQRNVAKVIRNLSERDSTSAQTQVVADKLCGDEALALYVDTGLTTNAYKQIRKASMKKGHYEYPSYHCLAKSKKSCYPPEEDIVVTETRAEINLQALLNKTVGRLVQAQKEVIKRVQPSSTLTLICKWGCDGSSGHSNYKQKFENAEDTDEFLFVFSFVPIRLIDNNDVIWQNPRPSSTMYCRPIKFIFAKETTELTKTETNRILEEVDNLTETVCDLGDFQISVKHVLLLTMTDGKVCNALTETLSSQKCYICGATPKTMNEPAINYQSNQDHYGFGLSTLHAWIRTFECCLHISYRLDIKKWQARSAEDKTSVKQRSDEIKRRFKQEMGLTVDKPKPGYGSSNDGNTARRFFGNPELSAQITGLDVTFIKQFDIILRALASGYEINLEEFKKLCDETRKHYLSLYSWYYMPATVHKILVHSVDVIKTAIVPIGQLSEEAQEARNKDCRRYREHNTRKCSRTATNRDLLNMLIITSDPLINSLRDLPKKKADKLCPEVLKLIVPPNVSAQPARVLAPHIEEDYIVTDSSEDDEEYD